MRKISIILLIACFSVLGSVAMVHAQARVEGSVTNAETGKPLEDVNVYLSGTKIGAATNASGRYRLRRVPAGGYKMVVSSIGYSSKIIDLIIGPTETKEINAELKPVIYELPEIYAGNLDKRWKKNLKHFTDYFIGESEWADSVIIINPEVLRFDKRWWGRLSAEALAPLKIENRALGYHITYYLDEFDYSGRLTQWDGEPLFTEMAPADSGQAAYWERNRKKAFYGSIRHFLLALLDDRVEEEGFFLFNTKEGLYGPSSDRHARVRAGRIIKDGKEEFLHRLNFYGQLEITYTREEETLQYVRWLQNTRRNPRGSQISYLELNEHPIIVDDDGEIIQPYGATQSGYFSFNRLAGLTPREYRPEGYHTSNGK